VQRSLVVDLQSLRIAEPSAAGDDVVDVEGQLAHVRLNSV
jgi:hypothetical protein